jgi:hypothetical protein
MTTPSNRLDLSGWKITLPVDSSGGFSGGAYEVRNLQNYEHNSYFYDDATGAVVFNAPVNGATTSGSSFARSELREMNGSSLAAWNLNTGGYMSATLEVDRVPVLDNGNLGRVIIGQIHGQDEELVRLYWDNNRLYFQNDRAGPDDEEMRFEFRDANGQAPNVSLNERFSYSIYAKGDTLTVKIYADGKEYTSTSRINDSWDNDTFYFKAGMYLGVTDEQGSGSGQASFYSLSYNHSGSTEPPSTGAPTVPPTNPPPSETPTDPTLPITTRTLNGTSSDNDIVGTSTNDLINAGAGNDELWGKGGQDVIWTGLGNDVITFDTALKGGPDYIMDFDPARDLIQLNDSVFVQLDTGQLSAFEFRLGTRALDSNDHIIYDRASGALWYDPDGSGSQAQIQFALIDNNASLTNLDFLII